MSLMKWYKNKAKINLAIDALMLVLLMAIAGMGFLIRYVLVSGYERNILYKGDVELYFWGLTRHEWGSIHLWVNYIFLFLLLIHIVLHWKLITHIFRQMVAGKTAQTAIAACIATVAILLAMSPFILKPEVVPFQTKNAHRRSIETLLKETVANENRALVFEDAKDSEDSELHEREEFKHRHSYEELEIYGYMTLNEVAGRYSIPINELEQSLHIPSGRSFERIGPLKRMYGFEMEDVKNAVIRLKDDPPK